MPTYATLLIPLYIHPFPQSLWDPLRAAASQYPDILFETVINPSNGPGSAQPNGCPDKDYVDALSSLTSYPNIRTMGYVHTANHWDCGDGGKDICFCTAPAEDVKKNISTYAAWDACEGWTPNVLKPVRVDDVFIDEAPGKDGGACLGYMSDLTAHAHSVLPAGAEVLFNAGAETELSYFEVADVIVIVENTQEAYEEIPDIGVRNGGGKYARKSSAIIHSASNETVVVRRDVNTILGLQNDAFHSLFYTDRATEHYQHFPYAWAEILEEANKVAQANKAIVGGK